MRYPKMYFYKRLVQAKCYIDQHFTSPLDIDLIADEACYSRFHFIRSFNDAFGFTPHQYLIHKRIQFSRKLLEEGASVTRTCFETGFHSPGSFSTLFKQRTGNLHLPIKNSSFRKRS